MQLKTCTNGNAQVVLFSKKKDYMLIQLSQFKTYVTKLYVIFCNNISFFFLLGRIISDLEINSETEENCSI